ncbi:hypothetical protein NC652_032178 [Populus alba x Populus x berolinensis]|uniref:Uncharacterized protein n=1 Tax=Populus alba x Populus x berolinensis TaxID=444605 RepID=A0AAD6LQL9_9ROSI|nr:hypothetical protein NC652_032178 [Populus alba x Populus x berolinensis]KAJ6971490.1 hypothetical protein NC653_032100 [Populus alba x Populus x berolinensis]
MSRQCSPQRSSEMQGLYGYSCSKDFLSVGCPNNAESRCSSIKECKRESWHA